MIIRATRTAISRLAHGLTDRLTPLAATSQHLIDPVRTTCSGSRCPVVPTKHRHRLVDQFGSLLLVIDNLSRRYIVVYFFSIASCFSGLDMSQASSFDFRNRYVRSVHLPFLAPVRLIKRVWTARGGEAELGKERPQCDNSKADPAEGEAGELHERARRGGAAGGSGEGEVSSNRRVTSKWRCDLISNVVATAVSSVSRKNPPELTFSSPAIAALGLSSEDKSLLRKIDSVAHTTLRDCMQTVYEDGPRRDQRLWIGDLRLQALAAYATFGDRDLVKRCLYLFAAMPYDDSGKLCACAYEVPEPHAGGKSIVDYCLLFTNTLHDYVKDSGDLEAGNDLFEIARKQFDIASSRIGEDDIYDVPIPKDLLGGGDWHFIDWQEKLDKSVAIQSVFIFCLNALVDLAKLLNKPEPVVNLHRGGAVPASELARRLRTAIRKTSFDGTAFLSGPDRQLSWASNAFAVLAGVTDSKEEAQTALRTAYESPEAIKGNTPYLHHYLCEAFIQAGLSDLALKHVLHYWGSIVKAGGLSFFECWIPDQPRFSPYGAFSSQSFCHAWSYQLLLP